eukprot:TRINITY_DN8109_c0_g1_i1.p1 TRINITY_DN8109_c0_g1~~TRINITY_DN8109_c0_g1_i1.p1  ORF type:complete len:442 (+),score=67.26 TRINITY_DN8109_c0_g1_i1:65-1390(+)
MCDPRAAGCAQAKEAWSDVLPQPKDVSEPERKVSLTKKVSIAAAWVLFGMFEGFLMVKAMVVYPKVLADQFVFKNFVVLKMFISAVASSMLFQGLLSCAAPALFEASRRHARYSYGYPRVMCGLALTGMGMAICGSGPTMIAPSMGALVHTSPWLFAGAMVAVLIFGALDRALEGTGFKMVASPRVRIRSDSEAAAVEAGQAEGTQQGASEPGSAVLLEPHTVEKLIGKLLSKNVSYSAVAIPLGLMMLMACVALELIVSFTDDVRFCGEYQPDMQSFSACPAWPPTLLGLSIGLAQIPVRLMHGDGMGGSGTFMTLASTVTFDRLFSGASLQASYRNGFSSWQLVYNFVCIIAGAFLAALIPISNEGIRGNHLLQDGFSPLQMFTGMFIAVGGALFAGGCTCGHGVSGVSELAVESWFGAAAIFGAAIATRYALVAIGLA